ncbi:metallophosphoesterase [Marinivivus vitaminiproducens]|uniref:metallophosphoesterase n=1 Tax=Marinivivus vitaminiproducens TaxID=3035935 RepID=UPI0027A9E389|nr:metallophosphoesterase [Geminicoccaceae bacterium SCSIO 64248]
MATLSPPAAAGLARVGSERMAGGLVVERLEIRPRGGAGAFAGYRIVQLSDFHLGVTSEAHVAAAIGLAASLAPDLVVLTGDYVQAIAAPRIQRRLAGIAGRHVDWRRRRGHHARLLAERVGHLLGRLAPPDGMLAIPGNHDYREGIGMIRRRLGAAVIWLVNRHHVVERAGERLMVAGVDDHRRGRPALDAIPPADDRRPERLRLLLAHNPDFCVEQAQAIAAGFDLVLAGHTHGGQIRLPFVGPLMTSTAQRVHVSGISRLPDGTPVYVSRGLGYGVLPLRLLCPPEIALFTIVDR